MDQWTMSDEETMVEEFAAALESKVVESLESVAMDATEEAYRLLGADDGMEVELPGNLDSAELGGEAVAEALMERPEVRRALVALGTLLINRLKTGI